MGPVWNRPIRMLPVWSNQIPALQAGNPIFKPSATDIADLKARAGKSRSIFNLGPAAIKHMFFGTNAAAI